MTSVSDNFNRDNGEIGADWTEDRGDIDIVSNQAVVQASPSTVRYTATALDGADHYVQADCINLLATAKQGIHARQETSTITLYEGNFYDDNAADGYRLYKRIDGAQTTLDSAQSAPGTQTGRLTVDGATQSFEIDDVEVCSDTDSDITAGTYCGLSANSTGGIFDNWSAEDLAVGGLSIPVAMHHYTKNIASGR